MGCFLAMSDPLDYTVGWICALPTEYAAAQALFDERHDRPRYVSRHDRNDYELGRIGPHNVVTAVFPAGEYGTSRAATVASDMLSTFTNIRVGLMVGIAGGAPSLDHDIRLGDVVVGVSTNASDKKYPYDPPEDRQEDLFQNGESADETPQILKVAVARLEAHCEDSQGHQLQQAIDWALEKYPRLKKKYQRPDHTTDRLHWPQFLDVETNQLVSATWQDDDPAMLVQRAERTVKDEPVIHYGKIGSSNLLLKDGSLRDKLADENDVLCFEMESAGLIGNFPCLVVRGISDYCDLHKNKEWQGYAAMAAAAYAKELLYQIPLRDMESQKTMREVLAGRFPFRRQPGRQVTYLFHRLTKNHVSD